MDCIYQGTACIVSNGSVNPNSLVGPTATSVVVLAPSVYCDTKLSTNGNNWLTRLKEDQSVYCSKLYGIITALIVLDILVCHNKIPFLSVILCWTENLLLIRVPVTGP